MYIKGTQNIFFNKEIFMQMVSWGSKVSDHNFLSSLLILHLLKKLPVLKPNTIDLPNQTTEKNYRLVYYREKFCPLLLPSDDTAHGMCYSHYGNGVRNGAISIAHGVYLVTAIK